MKGRKHLSYANVVATIALFGVVAGGGAYAASKIGTSDIQRQAITSKKLARGSVLSGKLAQGAIGANQLAPDAAGVALAGVKVDRNGTLLTWFNRLGQGQPRIEHPINGKYAIYLPGFEDFAFGGSIPVATLINADPDSGEAVVNSQSCSGLCTEHPEVITRDSSGVRADRSFSYLIFAAPAP